MVLARAGCVRRPARVRLLMADDSSACLCDGGLMCWTTRQPALVDLSIGAVLSATTRQPWTQSDEDSSACARQPVQHSSATTRQPALVSGISSAQLVSPADASGAGPGAEDPRLGVR